MAVKPRDFNVWEGIFPAFTQAPVVGLGFDDPIWQSRSAKAATDAHEDLLAGRPLEFSLRQRNSVLVVLAAALLSGTRKLRILDFGGGPGFGFLVLQAAIPHVTDNLEYRIVEVEGVCREASRMFAGRPGPIFQTELPAVVEGAFDIVFTASTLQYIEDWRGISRRLAGYGAPHLVFSDVFAGALSTYATTQQYYGSKIPHWFLNDDEFVAEISSTGYLPRLRTPCNVKVLDALGELPMDNFPVERRLKNTSHFMFSRTGRNF